MNREEYQITSRPLSVFHYQDGWHLLGHGKICPWCRETVMQYADMVIVYRIPRAVGESAKVLYHKLNWDWVCSEECARSMAAKWGHGKMAQMALRNRIAMTTTLPTIKRSPRDTRREIVLKLCRIDPKLDIETKVYYGFDFIDNLLDNSTLV
jgi:hypothetical protein